MDNKKIGIVGRNENKSSGVVGFNGVCPLCGSSDGMIIKGNDDRYRNMCRVLGCKAWYIPAPAVGFEKENDCREPFETDYLKSETVTIGEYIGRKES